MQRLCLPIKVARRSIVVRAITTFRRNENAVARGYRPIAPLQHQSTALWHSRPFNRMSSDASNVRIKVDRSETAEGAVSLQFETLISEALSKLDAAIDLVSTQDSAGTSQDGSFDKLEHVLQDLLKAIQQRKRIESKTDLDGPSDLNISSILHLAKSFAEDVTVSSKRQDAETIIGCKANRFIDTLDQIASNQTSKTTDETDINSLPAAAIGSQSYPRKNRHNREHRQQIGSLPWFGLDIGGTLTKLVYFEPTDNGEDDTEEEVHRGQIIRQYLIPSKAYGKTGVRDEDLQLDNVLMNGRTGTLHFIRFPTDRMIPFIQLVKSKGFVQNGTVCATGGGAIKYAHDMESELSMQLHKADELQSLISGIEFIAENHPEECYYYENPLDDDNHREVIWRWSSGRCSSTDDDYSHDDRNENGLQYPYVVCNIGSGVSVLVVRGHNDFERVSGCSIGGGTFQALCSFLCHSDTFEESVKLAAKGDNKNVDKLVGDIYGSAYDSIGLSSDTVAASFGKISSPKDRDNVKVEDLARSMLVTIANNIGSIALDVAKLHDIERIVFVGNFLRGNPTAARHLSNAMNFWSKGTKTALFLKHEGYFGAVGCLDKLVDVANTDTNV
uniref:pantothenate kinase n=1 Tax=Panagrellus redivivus TaxID=6233 RepID=A0A7E4WCZ9_PANRE